MPLQAPVEADAPEDRCRQSILYLRRSPILRIQQQPPASRVRITASSDILFSLTLCSAPIMPVISFTPDDIWAFAARYALPLSAMCRLIRYYVIYIQPCCILLATVKERHIIIRRAHFSSRLYAAIVYAVRHVAYHQRHSLLFTRLVSPFRRAAKLRHRRSFRLAPPSPPRKKRKIASTLYYFHYFRSFAQAGHSSQSACFLARHAS